MKLLIQTIDLSRWKSQTDSEEDLEVIARTWHSAFKSHGLVYLTNHGLETEFRTLCQEWLRFCACNQDHKNQFSSSEYGEEGYNRVGKEAVALSEDDTDDSDPDPVESLENGYNSCNFDGCFPRAENNYKHGDSLRDAYSDLFHQMKKHVIQPCLDMSTRALHLDRDLNSTWFEKGSGAFILRLARYFDKNIVEGNYIVQHMKSL